MVYGDTALIEYMVIPKQRVEKNRRIRFSDNLLGSVCETGESFHLFDALDHTTVGEYTRKELNKGIKISVDQSIIVCIEPAENQ